MKLMPEKNHEFARVMNCEIMKCEDPLYFKIRFCSLSTPAKSEGAVTTLSPPTSATLDFIEMGHTASGETHPNYVPTLPRPL